MDRDVGNAPDTKWVTKAMDQISRSEPDEDTLDRSVGEIERNATVFSTNLDRLMMQRGLRNSQLARDVGVSREMVAVWRQGKSLPTPARTATLASVLGATEVELFTETQDDTPPMLPIAQWARRENIPVGRAKSLFELGILTGSQWVGENVQLVPVSIRAPANSKHLVRVARRPKWVANFAINLDGLMREMQIQNLEMAEATGVGQCAVTHWRSGRGYPLTKRLGKIAETLGCDVEQLLANPLQRRVSQWKYRFGHAWHTPGERIVRPGEEIPEDDDQTEDVPVEIEAA